MKKTIRTLLCAALLLSLSFSAMASGTVTVTGSANIREGWSLDEDVIGKASKGDKFAYTGVSKKDDRDVRWYGIFYEDDEIGWISQKYAKVKENTYGKSDGETYVRATASTYLRSARDKDDPDNIVGGMSDGDELLYLNEKKKDERGVYWYRVKTKKGSKAWVSEKYTKLVSGGSDEDKVVADMGSTYLRDEPSLEGDIVITLRKGKSAKYLGKTKVDDRGVRWYKVRYNGKTGWVSYRYATKK